MGSGCREPGGRVLYVLSWPSYIMTSLQLPGAYAGIVGS